VETGTHVVILDDLSAGRQAKVAAALRRGAQLVVGEICDRAMPEQVFDSAQIVIHMACDNLRASLANPIHAHEVNATGTLVTCLAAVACGGRALRLRDLIGGLRVGRDGADAGGSSSQTDDGLRCE